MDILDENFTLENETWKNYSFKAETGKHLLMIADENVKAEILNQEGETLLYLCLLLNMKYINSLPLYL